MKTAEFQHNIGGTVECIKRPIMYFKRCGQLTSNYNCFSGSYLIGVKTSEEAMAEGVDYCRPVNTSHNFFLPSYVQKL